MGATVTNITTPPRCNAPGQAQQIFLPLLPSLGPVGAAAGAAAAAVAVAAESLCMRAVAGMWWEGVEAQHRACPSMQHQEGGGGTNAGRDKGPPALQRVGPGPRPRGQGGGENGEQRGHRGTKPPRRRRRRRGGSPPLARATHCRLCSPCRRRSLRCWLHVRRSWWWVIADAIVRVPPTTPNHKVANAPF